MGYKEPKGFDARKAQTPDVRAATGRARGKQQSARQPSSLPDYVANRMVRRAAVLCGLPTAMAMSVFVISYLLITNGMAHIPPIVTITLSASFFVIGLLGLSYGVLSASLEEAPGSLGGLEHFRKNIGRIRGELIKPPRTDP